MREEKSLMQSDLSVQASEIALLKANEKRMMRDGSDYREKVIYYLIKIINTKRQNELYVFSRFYVFLQVRVTFLGSMAQGSRAGTSVSAV